MKIFGTRSDTCGHLHFIVRLSTDSSHINAASEETQVFYEDDGKLETIVALNSLSIHHAQTFTSSQTGKGFSWSDVIAAVEDFCQRCWRQKGFLHLFDETPKLLHNLSTL